MRYNFSFRQAKTAAVLLSNRYPLLFDSRLLQQNPKMVFPLFSLACRFTSISFTWMNGEMYVASPSAVPGRGRKEDIKNLLCPIPGCRMPKKNSLATATALLCMHRQSIFFVQTCVQSDENPYPRICVGGRGGSDFPYKLTEECRAAYPFHIAAQYISGDGHLLRGFLLFSLLRVLWPSPLLLLSRGGRKGRVDVGIVYREKKTFIRQADRWPLSSSAVVSRNSFCCIPPMLWREIGLQNASRTKRGQIW